MWLFTPTRKAIALVLATAALALISAGAIVAAFLILGTDRLIGGGPALH